MAEDKAGASTRPSLLLRIRDPGDAVAWQAFVDVYGPLIYRHGRRRGLQDADAADLAQEVLFQVSRSIQKFEYRPEQGRFRDWLGTVTENKVRTFLARRAGVAQAQGEAGPADPLGNVAAGAQDTQWAEEYSRHILHLALTRIQPHFEEHVWRAFGRVWRDDRPPAEVARELDQTVDWVYMVKARVLKRLHEEVQELAEDMPLSLR
jgi:RNA polymerase sigma-70 factor (ECF subfamily)